MNTFPRHVVYLIAICAFLALAAFCAETSFPEKTSAASAHNLIATSATTTETVEETITLPPNSPGVKTWTTIDSKYPSNTVYWPCGLSSRGTGGFPPGEGEVIVGYDHFFDAGTKPAPCQERIDHVYRGTVRFDLSEIISKAPKFHVYVSSARLNFRKKDGEMKGSDGENLRGGGCADALLVASADWTKGTKSDVLIPGAPYKSLAGSEVTCGLGGCGIEVGPIVNNWVTGKEDNYGFVLKGENEEPHIEDNAACWSRYGDFSLSVTYKYDKTAPVIMVARPERPIPPGLELALVNLARGKTVSQSSTFLPGGEASHAVDGNTDGVYDNGSVSATASDSQAWWEVDLGSIQSIQSIRVWNRVEFPGRTKKFYVLVSDEPFTSKNLDTTKTQVREGRYFYTPGPCGFPTAIPFHNTGRYVRVQLSEADFLQLAEVEVIAGK